MVIDRERVKQAFQEYTGRYDIHDEKIRLKVEHTYRVADISEQIAEKLGLSEEDIALAWLIGMLHDIGRFEQLRRFHTFVDSQSIDHAHFGVELLFQDGLLARFVDNSGENEELIKKAIYWHSAFRIDPQLNDREMLFAKVIRDADKIDILKVATDFRWKKSIMWQRNRSTHTSSRKKSCSSFDRNRRFLETRKKCRLIIWQVILLWFLNWSFRKAMKLSRNRAIWIDC